MQLALEQHAGVHGYVSAGTSLLTAVENGARGPSPARGDSEHMTPAPDEEIHAAGRWRRTHTLLLRIRRKHHQDWLVLDDHDQRDETHSSASPLRRHFAQRGRVTGTPAV